MNFNSDERAPLEFTKPRSKTIELVCPHCKLMRHSSVDTISVICSGCGKYFSASQSLPASEAVGVVNTSKTIDKDFTKRKAVMEKNAYEWRDEQIAKGKLGTISHEPDGGERKW